MKRRRSKGYERVIKRFVKHMERTWRNKVWAIALLLIGALTLCISEDATAFVFVAIFAIPMFFSNRADWIV